MNRRKPKEQYYQLQNDMGETVPMVMSIKDGIVRIDRNQLSQGTYFLCQITGAEIKKEKFVVWRER